MKMKNQILLSIENVYVHLNNSVIEDFLLYINPDINDHRLNLRNKLDTTILKKLFFQ
jgi:hypothetical protein